MEQVDLLDTEDRGRSQAADVPPLPRRGRGASRWLLLFGAVALVCVISARDIRRGEFEYNVDEAQHAVTGLFLADAMRDMPWKHPLQYAYTYYAQYPAIAIFHWPPLFYVFEGLSFLLLGASGVSARLTVMLFTVLLLWEWFLLVEELQDSFTAAIATAVLGLLPMMLLFEKTVMLEIPSLALGVAAIRHWFRYLAQERRADLYAFGFWLTAALLCKQTSIFLIVFCVLTLLERRRWDVFFRREVLAVTAGVAILAGPFLVLMLFLQGRSVAHDLGAHRMSGWDRVTFYARDLPNSFPVGWLLLAALGLLLSRRWSKNSHTAIMVCWIAAGYLTFSFFGQRESRFMVYWIPPLVYFAVGLITAGFFRVSSRRMLMRGCAVSLVGLLSLAAWGDERPYISGYQDVAARLVNTYHSGIVLFDGRVPGDFVFYIRSFDPQRRFLVLRKMLHVDDIRPAESSEELVHSREELLEMLSQYGIRFVVVSENAPLRFPVQQMLRDQLRGDQFQLLGRFPIISNDPSWKGEALLLYENKMWGPPVAKDLKIRMLTLPHDIVVPLDRFEAGGR